MIRRLRRKFIVINMALVAAVLLIVFGATIFTNAQQLRAQSYGALSFALRREVGVPPEPFAVKGGRHGRALDGGFEPALMPVFTVTLEDGSDVRYLDSGHVDVDEAIVDAAVSQALAAQADTGTLGTLNLRYLREGMPAGTRIAFMDLTGERATLARLSLTLALVGVGGLAAFLIVSIFLANWALRPVEKAWAEQQRFVQDASHELKTPLTVILANLSILSSHGDATVASEAQWIDNTREEATRMRGLVDGMLFLAKGDAEPPRAHTPVSLTDVLWRSVLSFEPVAYEAGVTLDSDIADGVTVTGDESQIAQLATILLDNACKYAGEMGRVRLTLECKAQTAVIRVHNTGEAIDAASLPHVFERFYRADKARVHRAGGYGLGLAIAEQIVRRHGGKATAESSAEKGTTMTVTLPLSQDAA